MTNALIPPHYKGERRIVVKLNYLSVIAIDMNLKNTLWKPAYEESLGVLLLFFVLGQPVFAVLCWFGSFLGRLLLGIFIETIGGEPVDPNIPP